MKLLTTIFWRFWFAPLTASLTIAITAIAMALQHDAAPAKPVCSDSCDLAAHTAHMHDIATSNVDGVPQVAGMSPATSMSAQPVTSAAPTAESGESAALHAMQDRQMRGHMMMTPSRPQSTADRVRAEHIVASLRAVMEPYRDYHAALAAGYVPFHPELPIPMVHFTNWHNAIANLTSFDATRPTSLMYRRIGNGYQLVGAMYTAPRSATLDDLNARVPLSVATWHEHTNLCLPQRRQVAQAFGPNARFGLAGSTTTADECRRAGGTFVPVIFNWMVHVWPYERDPSKVWATADDPGTMNH